MFHKRTYFLDFKKEKYWCFVFILSGTRMFTLKRTKINSCTIILVLYFIFQIPGLSVDPVDSKYDEPDPKRTKSK